MIKFNDGVIQLLDMVFRNILFYFGYLCLVETLIIEGNDGFTVGNRYLK